MDSGHPNEQQRLTLDEWWQIHYRIPTHTACGREYTQSEVVRMRSARVAGCQCDHPVFNCIACAIKGIDTVEGVGV